VQAKHGAVGVVKTCQLIPAEQTVARHCGWLAERSCKLCLGYLPHDEVGEVAAWQGNRQQNIRCIKIDNNFSLWLEMRCPERYIGCFRRNVPYFGSTFVRFVYMDVTKLTYVRRWLFTEVMTRGICGLFAVLRTVHVSRYSYIAQIGPWFGSQAKPSQAKPNHTEASVLCEVLGTLRTILMKLMRDCHAYLMYVTHMLIRC
jgi:hypothetical protein